MSDELRPVQSFFVDEELGVALPVEISSSACQCLDEWDECWCFEE